VRTGEASVSGSGSSGPGSVPWSTPHVAREDVEQHLGLPAGAEDHVDHGLRRKRAELRGRVGQSIPFRRDLRHPWQGVWVAAAVDNRDVVSEPQKLIDDEPSNEPCSTDHQGAHATILGYRHPGPGVVTATSAV
jgi:hypothetical protein